MLINIFLSFRVKIDAHFQCMHLQLLQHCLLKLLFYLHGNTFAHLLKNQLDEKKLVDINECVYFWILCYILMIYVAVALLLQKMSWVCRYVVSFKIECCETSCFIPLLQKCFFPIWVPFSFHIIFRISLTISINILLAI